MFWVPGDVIHEQVEAKGDVRRMKCERSMQSADFLKQFLSVSLQCSMDLAQEKCSFFWLTSLPIQEFGFALHKRVFQGCPGSPLHLATIVSSLHMCLCMVRHSPLNMLCHTLRMASLPFDIMKLGTWQLIYPQKSAMMSALSLNLYPLMVRCSLGLHHTLRMGQDGYCC